MTRRSEARHRAPRRPASALLTVTGPLAVVGDRVGSVCRSGAVLTTSGLMATAALPGHALPTAFAEGVQKPVTASIPVVGAATGARDAASDDLDADGALAVPGISDDDAPLAAPVTAVLDFDRPSFVVVPEPRPAAEAPRSAPTRPAQPTSRREARAGTAAAPAHPRRATRVAARSTSGEAARTSSPVGISTGAAGSRIVATAMRYLGVPYRYGGTTPNGFDCSGLTQYVYRTVGKELPRTVAQQRAAVRIIPRSQAKPGDLVIFGTTHIAIYLGGNKMLAAPHTGDVVKVQDIYSASVVFGRA